jgi:hypothetical protein
VRESPPPRQSKLLTRKQLVQFPVAQRKQQGQWFKVESTDVPDKLVLRSHAGANDIFAVFNLAPRAGHGHLDAPALVCLTCDDTALLTDTCYGDRQPDDHSQLVVQRLRGGQLAANPATGNAVKRFAEEARYTFCEVESGDYSGWGALRTRQILFVKNALLWVRDTVEFTQPMEASAGTLWFASELCPARGANWFDVQWNEPRGFRWLWRNGDRRLLICLVRQSDAAVGVQFEQWKTQRGPIDWSPPWCIFHKRGPLSAAKGTRVHFNALLIPHGPDSAPHELASRVSVVEDRVESTTLRVKLDAAAWRLTIGPGAAAVQE